MKKKDKAKLIVFPIELVEKLEHQAKKEDRSVSSLIRWAVIQYLNESEK